MLSRISYEAGVCQGKQSMCKIVNIVVWKEQWIVGMGENTGQVWVVWAGESVIEEEDWERDNGEQVDQKEDLSEDSASWSPWQNYCLEYEHRIKVQ